MKDQEENQKGIEDVVEKMIKRVEEYRERVEKW